jgi:SAM-dependent methyltransferase
MKINLQAVALRLLSRRKKNCPVCKHPVKHFLPLSSEFRDQAIKYGYPYFGKGETINLREYSCPHCGASDRERLYTLFLDKVVQRSDFENGRKILHFAPEPALSARIQRMGRFDYRTADIAMEDVNDQIDITHMSIYGDAAFDAFICSHVLEHVQNDNAALCELYRILKPGGWGILMVPLMTHFDTSIEGPTATTEADRWRLFGQGDHVRLYAKSDFLKRVTQAGFSVEQLGADYFGSDTFRRCGITPSSTLYVVNHD